MKSLNLILTICAIYVGVLISVACAMPTQAGTNREEEVITAIAKSDTTMEPFSIDTVFLPSIDTALRKMIGDTVLSLVLQADTTIAAFKLSSEADTTALGFYDFKVLGRKEALNSAQQTTLVSLLTSKENYWITRANKRCGFRPAAGFKFQSSATTDPILVLIALDCDVIKFVVNGEVMVFNTDPGHTHWQTFVESLF